MTDRERLLEQVRKAEERAVCDGLEAVGQTKRFRRAWSAFPVLGMGIYRVD